MKINELLEFIDTSKDSVVGKAIDKVGARDAVDKIGNSFSNVFNPEVEPSPSKPAKNTNTNVTTKSKNSVDISDMDPEFERQGIKDPFVKKALMAKFHQEAGAKLGTTEIPFRNTANSRIREKLPQLSSMSDAELDALKSDDRAFFNRAYGGVIGNRDPDDGWKYRGRGLTGLTGKQNYADADAALGLKGELIKNPDLLLNPEIDKKASVWYYKRAGADKLSFDNQEEANMWAIHKAGGRAYAPGTKLGNIALADLNNKTGNMVGTAGAVVAGSTLLSKADSIIDRVKSSGSQFISSITSPSTTDEEEVELVINGKKKKFKNKKEADRAIMLAQQLGHEVKNA